MRIWRMMYKLSRLLTLAARLSCYPLIHTEAYDADKKQDI